MTENEKLLKSDKLKVDIMKILLDEKYHTPSEIAIKLRTNSYTIMRNCYFLNLLGFIKIEMMETKQKITYIKLLDKGKRKLEEILAKLK